jgi:dolichyl-diphosphooligosaccharide--protein glycosyltransferase
MSGTTKWSGRVLSLIDPNYAKVHMPLVASVSEHQPTMWVNYFSDFSVLLFFVPIGFYYNLVHKVTHGKLFIAMWGVFCVYFSCAMVRLMLVLAPAVCVLAAIAVSHIVTKASKNVRLSMIGSRSRVHSPDISILVLLFVFYILKTYVFHQMSFAHSQSSPTFII